MSLSRWMPLVGVLLILPGSALAQPGSDATSVPRTASGRPDLQGVWDFRSLTPMQRPRALGEQEVFTLEEAAEFSADTIRRRSRDSETSDRAARVAQGDIIPYNDFWFDEGTSVTSDRTSLIVDPADGRMPALTPEAERTRTADREARRGVGADEPPPGGWVEDLQDRVRCTRGFNSGPPLTPSAYNNNMQLFQTPGYVVVLAEMVHDARIISLDGRPLPPAEIQAPDMPFGPRRNDGVRLSLLSGAKDPKRGLQELKRRRKHLTFTPKYAEYITGRIMASQVIHGTSIPHALPSQSRGHGQRAPCRGSAGRTGHLL